MDENIQYVQFHKQNLDSVKNSILQLLTSSGFLKSEQDQKLIKQEHVHCFSIFKNQQAIAYLVLSVLLEQAEIFHVYVLPEHRQKKYGYKILTCALDYCKKQKVEKVFLELRLSNDKAYKLYKKHGFVELTHRKDYYPDGEDAMVMQFLF